MKAKSFTGTFTMSVKWQVIRKDDFFIISCFSRPFTKNEGWRVINKNKSKGISYPLIPKKILKIPFFKTYSNLILYIYANFLSTCMMIWLYRSIWLHVNFISQNYVMAVFNMVLSCELTLLCSFSMDGTHKIHTR